MRAASAVLEHAPWSTGAGLPRLLRTCAPTWFAADIKVPNMGDSISEGTVAQVLKKAGDAIKTDEVLAQIETDKVTIDVKAPSQGRLAKLLISQGTVVRPGQLIAVVDDSGAGPSNAKGTASTASASAAAAPSPSAGAHRTPSIHFPPRRTDKGDRISDMPAGQALAALQALGAGAHPTAHPAAPAAPPAPAPAGGSTPQPQPAAPTTSAGVAGSAKAASSQLLSSAPRRRPLTAHEIEVVDLGGAEPYAPKAAAKEGGAGGGSKKKPGGK